MQPNRSFDKQIKERILEAITNGFNGARLVIPVWDGKDFVFEKSDMVKAIFKIGKRKK